MTAVGCIDTQNTTTALTLLGSPNSDNEEHTFLCPSLQRSVRSNGSWMIRYIVPMFNSYRYIQRKEQTNEQRLLRFWIAIVIQDVLSFLLLPIVDRITGLGLEIQLFFTFWLVHPYFAGYERVYDYWVNKKLMLFRDRIEHVLYVLHDENWRWVTFLVQSVMRYVDDSLSSVNTMVSPAWRSHRQIANKPPSQHVK